MTAPRIRLQSRELLQVVEDSLVHHPAFGDSDYILTQFEHCSERRLAKLADNLPSAKRLHSALASTEPINRYHVYGNTVIRSAIQQAQVQVETGEAYGLPLSHCEAIFEETAQHLASGKPGTPFEHGSFELPSLKEDDAHSARVWREDYPDTAFGRSFRYLVSQNWGGSLSIPTSDEVAMLRQGVRLLHALLPQLAESALRHVHVVGIFDQGGGWKRTASSSQIRVGGAIFLARTLLRSPWVVAEHLLHEALHHKLYDFRHGHTLLVTDSSEMDKVKVISPWNPEELTEANRWDPHRAFAALHVYVQLCVLAQMAEHRREELKDLYGPTDGMIDYRSAYVRAWYLGEQLKRHCWHLLGPGGQAMLDWLIEILQVLEPSVPPPEADLHLVLDLYCREARGLGSSTAVAQGAPKALVQQLDRMAHDEIATTCEILSAVGATKALERFEGAVADDGAADIGIHFRAIREVIASTLLSTSPDGFGFTSGGNSSGDPLGLVHRMVREGSQRLHVALNGLPAAVAAGKRRAHEQNFHTSCIDEVGRLLAVLAAAVPPGGRILEIGTGVGIGTGWMCSALGDQSDVNIVSVEIDPRLSAAAADWSWPDNVTFIAGDIMDRLDTLETYDLVFADASPVKHADLDAVVPLLRPGGTLVIDDLHVDGADTGELQALQHRLRRAVLNHPDLHAVELDWASGVIVAVRTRAAGDNEAHAAQEPRTQQPPRAQLRQ